MTWFKVDDKLHAHRKPMRAGVEAMGLWVLAGSWAMDQLTDGFVPDYVAAKIDPSGWREKAEALVRARLWIPAENDGDQGWQFHEFNEPGRQPTAAQVYADRAATAMRQERWRAKARTAKQGAQGSSNGVTHASPSPLVPVYPTRPDPPLKGGGEEVTLDHESLDREVARALAREVAARPSRLPPRT